MNPLDVILNQQPSPPRLKVFAPNGDTKEAIANMGVRRHSRSNQMTELCLLYSDGTVEVLNKKVVIQNLETGEVCYNPRTAPRYVANRVFITGDETFWLNENPSWPGVLELWDNPTEDNDGLNP